MNENVMIAQTIHRQLGGSRFNAMTGARDLVAGEKSLRIKLPSNFAKSGINFVEITLDPSDTYTLTYGKIRKVQRIPTYKQIGETAGIYADQLRRTFTEITGLDTHL